MNMNKEIGALEVLLPDVVGLAQINSYRNSKKKIKNQLDYTHIDAPVPYCSTGMRLFEAPVSVSIFPWLQFCVLPSI